ncbi:autophagy protein 5 [Datura stramonium]|uniref:Autophagy protein 5 n=1 Tax=Datura stramonium TaxID=4076 RepID=A0ABS8STV5_DATST|nr:autophagy protein 5 [Datura stramonium]
MGSKGVGTEAQRYIWEGAIPLQIHLHESEVTTLPPPPPALILAPRIGYLPLLAQKIKPFFSNSLPPGVDTIWFEYNGLPLKWYIPTGVLFDLLCAEPERPWNLMDLASANKKWKCGTADMKSITSSFSMPPLVD